SYTYQAALPAGSSVPGPYGGVLPIGDVHPNALDYQVIADDMAEAGGLPLPPSSVPEPATWALLAAALGALGLALPWQSRRAKRAAA
ncbi:MAG: PEP-CTERM sorting domain-containing protein, partial [Acetobacteraceae bacterium]|nr:PEP-CTERM sorting domain-containing protein [Acetobacteraceae bacterium]